MCEGATSHPSPSRCGQRRPEFTGTAGQGPLGRWMEAGERCTTAGPDIGIGPDIGQAAPLPPSHSAHWRRAAQRHQRARAGPAPPCPRRVEDSTFDFESESVAFSALGRGRFPPPGGAAHSGPARVTAAAGRGRAGRTRPGRTIQPAGFGSGTGKCAPGSAESRLPDSESVPDSEPDDARSAARPCPSGLVPAPVPVRPARSLVTAPAAEQLFTGSRARCLLAARARRPPSKQPTSSQMPMVLTPVPSGALLPHRPPAFPSLRQHAQSAAASQCVTVLSPPPPMSLTARAFIGHACLGPLRLGRFTAGRNQSITLQLRQPHAPAPPRGPRASPRTDRQTDRQTDRPMAPSP